MWDSLTQRERHFLLALAAVGDQQRTDCVLSHVSAAVVHGLPVWNLPLRQVHLTQPSRTGGRILSHQVLHSAPLEAADTSEANGALITSPARTVVDVARTAPFEQAVVIGDAALNRGLVTRSELDAALAHARNWKGIASARRAVAFMDNRSESPGESRSRVLFHNHGLAAPHLQASVFDEAHALVGRADFLYDDGLIGEFDGKVKYGALLNPGETAADAVIREKRREDAFRELGWLIIRWMWDDLNRPLILVRRVLQALSRARAQRRPSGLWVPA
ncbi:hypothetical protein ONR57_21280 [Hoyosella sp. YIM 151337]|uniref:hypothetical protein n=1 Tax=Hoyosella sp. YIM 151337 TaxID=2992742 RepID=UPI0022357FCB|nr:hypothetical protein [Hoyosella sp. YIM 151337]MCW4355841.1 hypothetical protein [Hoyosella sp. YIM 151337]